MTNTGEIYDLLDRAAPFSGCESWDNCGILVGEKSRSVSTVLTALDITKKVAEEAVRINADLVLSHHPVIFRPLKNLSDNDPAVILAKNNISVICMHTNLDLAPQGLNRYLCRVLGFNPEEGVPLDFDDGKPIGCVCELSHEVSCEKLAEMAKTRLGCKTVRYNLTSAAISRVGICSGSGGDFLKGAIENKCQALITGDVKHNVFIDAENCGITVIDAGHFYTERIFCRWAEEILTDAFPEILVITAEACTDPCDYV